MVLHHRTPSFGQRYFLPGRSPVPLTYTVCPCMCVLRTHIQGQTGLLMPDPSPQSYPRTLTRAAAYLAELLETNGKPVVTQFDFFQAIWRMYQESSGKKLYLRSNIPTRRDYERLKDSLRTAGIIGFDRDYGARVIRVLTLSDLPAEDIVCLIDPTCHISHISAMQRWGLTDRRPRALVLTRPIRHMATAKIKVYMAESGVAIEASPFPPKIVKHPALVRRRPIQVHESKVPGEFVKIRGDAARISTIGQTFLDMLQKPDLCGGMSHVLDVWEEHAETFLDEIVAIVNTATSRLVKSRAGYIIEERLGLRHQTIESWKALGQRGGSRKLDPTKDFVPIFSETWMISLNA